MFTLDSLRTDAFSWKTALSLATASKLSYEQEVAVQNVVRNSWGFAKCDFLDVGDTQGFVAQTSDVVLVAFRGTESLGDWLGNLNLLSTQRPYGSVHRGFLLGFELVHAKITQALAQGGTGTKRVLVDGPQPRGRPGYDRRSRVERDRSHYRHPHLRSATCRQLTVQGVHAGTIRGSVLPLRQRRRHRAAGAARIRACRQLDPLRRARKRGAGEQRRGIRGDRAPGSDRRGIQAAARGDQARPGRSGTARRRPGGRSRCKRRGFVSQPERSQPRSLPRHHPPACGCSIPRRRHRRRTGNAIGARIGRASRNRRPASAPTMRCRFSCVSKTPIGGPRRGRR